MISAIHQFLQADANFNCQKDDLFCEFTCYSVPSDPPTWVYIENNYWSTDFESLTSQNLLEQPVIEGPQHYCILYWNHPRLQAVRNAHKLESSNEYDFLSDILWASDFSGVGEMEWWAISDFYSIIESEIITFLNSPSDQIA